MKTPYCKKCGEIPDEDPQAPYLGAFNGARIPNEHFPGSEEETDDSPSLPEPWWANQ